MTEPVTVTLLKPERVRTPELDYEIVEKPCKVQGRVYRRNPRKRVEEAPGATTIEAWVLSVPLDIDVAANLNVIIPACSVTAGKVTRARIVTVRGYPNSIQCDLEIGTATKDFP